MPYLTLQLTHFLIQVFLRCLSMSVCCNLALANKLLFLWLYAVLESMAEMLTLLAESVVTSFTSHAFEQSLFNLLQDRQRTLDGSVLH